MPEHSPSLNTAYQDMRDRYGEDDLDVMELKIEMERRENRQSGFGGLKAIDTYTSRIVELRPVSGG